MRFVFQDTARLSVLIFLTLQASLNSESEGPRWYRGCYEGSSLGFPDGWHQALTDREPDPAFCSKLCFDRGYQMAALSGQMCSCPRTGAASLDQPLNSTVSLSDTLGNSTRGCSAHSSESCMNASLSEQENAPASQTCLDRCDGRLCLSYGTQGKSYAVYSTLGPYIRNVSLTLGGESAWAGRPFTLEVSGYLAHSWRQPLGIPDLRPDNVSSVQLVIRWTPYFQSSRSVAVLENGFFSCSSVWTFQEPGIYNISVTVSNAVSQESGNVSVLTLVPEPSALEVTAVQRPQDVPSCVPFPVTGTEFPEKVFLGHTSTFKASVAMGEDLEFSWQFSDDDSTHRSGRDCDTLSDCLTSTVNHTFEKEGIYQIIVNVSNAYNWIRRVISVAVVPQVLSNLTLVSRSGYAVAAGQEVTLEVGLFTTVRPLLRLRVSLQAGVSYTRQLGHSSRRLPWAETLGWPGCQLRAQVVHRYGTAGSFQASAEVFSQEATGRAALPRPVQVYEPIQEVRPAAPWDTALRSGANSTLAVVSSADRRGSAVLWIVSRGSSAFLSTTTLDWSLTLCLQDEGHYTLQVMAFNPISNASFTTQLLVQDVISGLSIFSSSPKHIRTGTLVTLNAAVVTGTNVTYSWKFGANSSLVSDSETAVHLYSQPGVYIVSLRAENQVSCAFSNALEFTVQDPVGDFAVRLPRTVAVNHEARPSFAVRRGTDMTVTVHANGTLVYNDDRYVPGNLVTLNFTFTQLGPVDLVLRATNQVSSNSSTATTLVVKEIHGVTIELTQRPVVGESVTLIGTVNEPVVSHQFLTAASFAVAVKAHNHLGSVTASTGVSVLHRMPSVEIHTDKSAYATDSEVVFVAVTEEPGPLEFLWHFGDKSPERTVSRRITKRFPSPGRYNVVVEASNKLSSFASGIYPVTIQRAVQPNRLFSDASALLNANVSFDCRINAGTSVSYRWNFGDGNQRTGRSSEYHVFNRTGEFTVEVTVSNLVSSASLTRQIFIVPEPCQPPPVKNMGPFKVKVSRHGALRLGVTFEADVQCGGSRALLYQWAVYDASGAPVLLPPLESGRQVIKVPKHSLHYGTYTAIARVQIKGSVVYSNYSVRIEVVPTPPVSVIIGGTNIFISSKNESLLTLDGQGSYDPDYPHNPMRYSWDCEPVSGVKSSCFDGSVSLSSPVVQFPAGFLKRTFDQFRFELKVQSGDRSSAAEVFVTVKEGLSRKIRVTCPKCRGSTVNWSEQFSVQALCENCGESENVTFTWNLYLVNASSKIVLEVPFCKTLDVSVPAGFLKEPPSAAHTPPASSSAPPPPRSPPVSRSSPPSRTSSAVSAVPTGASISPKHPAAPLTADTPPTSPLSTSGPSLTPVTFSPADSLPFPFPFPEEGEPPGGRPRRERSPAPTGPERRTNSPTPSGPAPGTDYELYYNEIEEADSGTYEGRPIGSGISIEEPWGPEPAEGNDLVDPHSVLVQPPVQTLLDLDRQLVDRTVLRTFTLSGISSPVITFKPFMLKAKSLYMLEVTAASKENSLGKTQFFFSTNEVPDGMTCQVQPSKGYEVHTDFSIFCTSGKETTGVNVELWSRLWYERPLSSALSMVLYMLKDLLYEYSFSTGPSPRTVLYRGWDFQYYFKLPSGDPADNYKVTIYTEIRNRFGSATKLCPVNVTVLPSFQRNLSSIYSPDQELYVDGLRNLTALLQMGNIVETRNYVIVLTRVLNRLSPGPAGVRELQRRIRMALISAVCQLPVDDQESMIDNLSMLKDLIHVTDQLTLDSARRVTSHIQATAARLHEPGAHTSLSLDEWTTNALVSLLAGVLEAPLDPGEEAIRLSTDSLRTASDLLLRFVLSSDAAEHSASTRLVEVKTRRLARSGGTVLGAGPASFRLPSALSGHGGAGPCLVAQLVLLRRGQRLWSRLPAQIDGDVADLRLYNCTTRKEIKVRSLSTPVHIEFEKRRNNGSSSPEYSLLRSQMNVHEFNVTAGHQQEALQITVQLTRPSSPPFPIMLLFRMFEKPTPSSYNVKRIHSWEGNTVHIFMPPLSVKDPGSYYVALLNADYNRTPTNKYIASAVSYTLSIEWTQCLYWDGGKDWRSEGCSPLQSWSASKVNCSCNHLTTFTIAYQEISSHYSFTDVSQFISLVDNLVLCSVTFVFLGIYLVLAVVCKRADLASERRSGLVFLQDNSPLDRQFYAITVDTGFRSRATMTAKVHIVLHGEDGTSETRELSCSGKLLFGRNSRHTFILSAPDSLGPIWKAHIWHDGRGRSPSWFVSHLAVRDVASGAGWLFPAECWLAADEGDGKVERELTPLTRSPGFGKLLYATLTELLEDFHLWASVCTRPSHSPVSHSQRLALCLLLLLGYTGLNALLVGLRDDQFSAALGLIDVSCDSLVMGVCSTLTVFPLVVLVSLLFRFSEVTDHKHTNTGDHSAGRASDIFSVEAHLDGLLAEDSLFESYQSWHSLQHWAQEVWRKKYERGDPDGRAASVVSLPGRGPSRRQGGQCGSECSSSGFEDGSPAARTLRSSSELSCTPSSEQGCGLEQHTSGGRRALPPWCRHVAWALCLSLSATCAIVTGVLGMKFNSSQCLLWIHSVFVSLLFCVSVLQPVAIFIMAVVVSLKNKDRCDFYKGHEETGSALQMVQNWRLRGGCAPESHLYSPYHHRQHGHTHFDRIVAARQRARYLRLVRPPSPAQLRELRDRMKKESLMQNNFRELVLCTLMLLLLLFVTYGKFSSSHYRLNHAVRTEFTRSPKHPFLEVKTHEDWWNWCLTTFLDGLYWNTWYNNASARNKAGAVRGTCVLIGEPTLKKVEATADAACEAEVPGADREPAGCRGRSEQGRHGPCGQISCYGGRGTQVSLGGTRAAASLRLQQLRASGWLGADTRAVLAEFTLFNAPANLFAAVSLLAEKLPAGQLLPSASVESVGVYRLSSGLEYSVLASEMLFLVLILLQTYYQACAMTQKGLLTYWQDPWNWLQVTAILISLLYYACSLYNYILTVESIDHLQRENFKAFVDLSLLSSWEQLRRGLHGLLVSLLLVKCVFVLRVNKLMALSVTTLRLSFSSLTGPVVAGVIIIAAYACLGNLIFLPTSRTFSTFTRALQTLLTHHMGQGQLQTLSSPQSANHLFLAVYYGTFSFIITTVWTAVIIGILTSLARAAKRSSRKKPLVTFSEVWAFLRDKALELLGRRRPRWTDSSIQRHNFYLEEFDSLMDELLFRLNALSDSLHHTLPAKQPACKEGESSGLCQSGCDCSLDLEHAGDSKGQARRKGGKTEGLLFQDGPEMYHVSLPFEEGTVRKEQNQLRSQLEWEPLQRKGEGIALTGSQGSPEEPSCSPDRAGPPRAGVRAGLPEGAGPWLCASAPDSRSAAADPDHYSLASLGHDLPHVLCGTRCPEKRASQSGASCPGVPPTGLPARNHRVLTRSRSAVIQTAADTGPARLPGPRSPPGGSGKGGRLKGRSRIVPASGPTPEPRARPARQCW